MHQTRAQTQFAGIRNVCRPNERSENETNRKVNEMKEKRIEEMKKIKMGKKVILPSHSFVSFNGRDARDIVRPAYTSLDMCSCHTTKLHIRMVRK